MKCPVYALTGRARVSSTLIVGGCECKHDSYCPTRRITVVSAAQSNNGTAKRAQMVHLLQLKMQDALIRSGMLCKLSVIQLG